MEELQETQQYAGRDRREAQQTFDGPDRRKEAAGSSPPQPQDQPARQKPETD